jgi:HAE1 family hydrophobic/amphiphilic exporter-1
MWFTRVSISNPVFATMLMVGLLVLGLFSYGRLAVEQFPNVEFPVVVVSTKYAGASPEVVESDITRRIEEAVNTISGLKTLTSRSYEGQSLVIAEFDLKSDAAQAAQDVREKVAAVRAVFRKEVDEPVITRFNPEEFPIISLAIRSPKRSVRESRRNSSVSTATSLAMSARSSTRGLANWSLRAEGQPGFRSHRFSITRA